ncbi:hypothetical protein [Lacrimispora sp.]|uniref:hypothetical protein n=1 Tax=Lacrimispora sp. TaxID=2719234 RepID=UPI0028609D5C|nr:hypothetical protein [Lacrimispora sp.]MDR7812680.1 hypothetical protein [Lacrimispora sp.]
MIWDVLILGLVAATVTILATTGIIAVIIDAVTIVMLILVLKQKERHIVKVLEMAATIHAAGAKDRRV